MSQYTYNLEKTTNYQSRSPEPYWTAGDLDRTLRWLLRPCGSLFPRKPRGQVTSQHGCCSSINCDWLLYKNSLISVFLYLWPEATSCSWPQQLTRKTKTQNANAWSRKEMLSLKKPSLKPLIITIMMNRNQRMIMTMTKIGPAVLNGGMSTLLAFSLLYTSQSYVFLSFFKVWSSSSPLRDCQN